MREKCKMESRETIQSCNLCHSLESTSCKDKQGWNNGPDTSATDNAGEIERVTHSVVQPKDQQSMPIVFTLIQQKAWNVFEDLKAKLTSVTVETLAVTVRELII